MALNARPKFVASRTLDKVNWKTPSCSRATLPRRLRSARHRKAARFRSTAAATSSKPYISTISSIPYVFGSFLSLLLAVA